MHLGDSTDNASRDSPEPGSERTTSTPWAKRSRSGVGNNRGGNRK